MKVQRYDLLLFEEGLQDSYVIEVPKSSEFLQLAVMHEGIVAFYAVPSKEENGEQDRKFQTFRFLKPGEEIPDGYKFLAILEAVIEMPSEETPDKLDQGIMIFPAYKKE